MILWRCWLGGRKGIRPVKNWVVGAGVVICLEQSADLHMAQLMPLPLTVSCFSKIQIGFTFLVPAHPGSPWQRAVKCVCVCVSMGGPTEQCIMWGPESPGKGQFGWHLPAHCEVWGLSGMSQSCLEGGSSDAAFCCQYCSSLFKLIMLYWLRLSHLLLRRF